MNPGGAPYGTLLPAFAGAGAWFSIATCGALGAFGGALEGAADLGGGAGGGAPLAAAGGGAEGGGAATGGGW
jgi:hypothetical protein